MSRQRFIYPDLYESEKYGQLTLGARVLYVAMFTTADDYGRGKASARHLKATAFRYDDFTTEQVEAWLQEILELPCTGDDRPWLELYIVDGTRYYHCPGWQKRQTPRYKGKSLIPEPSGALILSVHKDAGTPGDPPANPRRICGSSEEKRGSSEVKRRGVGVEEGWGAGEGGSRPRAVATEDIGQVLRSVAAKAHDSAAVNGDGDARNQPMPTPPGQPEVPLQPRPSGRRNHRRNPHRP